MTAFILGLATAWGAFIVLAVLWTRAERHEIHDDSKHDPPTSRVLLGFNGDGVPVWRARRGRSRVWDDEP